MAQALVQGEERRAWLSVAMAFVSPMLLALFAGFQEGDRDMLWPDLLIYPAFLCALLGFIWGIQARRTGMTAIAGIILNGFLLFLELWLVLAVNSEIFQVLTEGRH
jgi:hypothetical protein